MMFFTVGAVIALLMTTLPLALRRTAFVHFGAGIWCWDCKWRNGLLGGRRNFVIADRSSAAFSVARNVGVLKAINM